MSGPTRGLFDTSIFIASESGRPLETSLLPDEGFVSVITIAELQAGVHAAKDTATRARRIATLGSISHLEPLAVTAEAAGHWASFRVILRDNDRRINVNDLWVAAVAAANDLTVFTQDDDFSVLEALVGLPVVRV